MSGAKQVIALIDKDGAYIDALNPLAITGVAQPSLPAVTTATKTSLTGIGAVTSVLILAANASAKGRVLYNAGSVVVYISYGTTQHTGQATATYELAVGASYTMKIRSDGSVEWPGEIRGIVGGVTTGAINTTELT